MHKHSGKQMEIVPRASLGPVRMRARREELPKEALVEGDQGRIEQIDFRLANGEVDEIWIADLRKFPHELLFKGVAVDALASSAKLRGLFGVCTRHKVDLNVSRYLCQDGIALAFIPDESATAVELRVRR